MLTTFEIPRSLIIKFLNIPPAIVIYKLGTVDKGSTWATNCARNKIKYVALIDCYCHCRLTSVILVLYLTYLPKEPYRTAVIKPAYFDGGIHVASGDMRYCMMPQVHYRCNRVGARLERHDPHVAT